MTSIAISVANMKGGVGKTTIAIGLAQMLAQSSSDAARKKILVVDLDAQANASFWLCGDQALTELIKSGKTLDAFLEDSVVFNQAKSLKDFLHTVSQTGVRDGAISVIPCSPELRLVEREMIFFLAEQRGSLKQVEKVVSDLFVEQLSQLKEVFDVIIFDTAPGISALTEAALRASDIVVVPTVPDFISTLGLEAFCQAVWRADLTNSAKTPLMPWVIANRVKDVSHHAAMLREMRAEADAEDAGFKMFQIEIPYSDAIEAASGRARESGDASLFFDVNAVLPFQAFAAEVMGLVNAPAAAPIAQGAT